jgi:hypothetical protein
MSLEQLSYLAQILGSVGVVISLVFVGLQIKHNTSALVRNEHNSTMAQWTVIRQAIATNRDVAELMTAGSTGSASSTRPTGCGWSRCCRSTPGLRSTSGTGLQRGVFPPGTFEWSCGELLGRMLRTQAGGRWWRDAKNMGFVPAFVRDVDAVLAKGTG